MTDQPWLDDPVLEEQPWLADPVADDGDEPLRADIEEGYVERDGKRYHMPSGEEMMELDGRWYRQSQLDEDVNALLPPEGVGAGLDDIPEGRQFSDLEVLNDAKLSGDAGIVRGFAAMSEMGAPGLSENLRNTAGAMGIEPETMIASPMDLLDRAGLHKPETVAGEFNHTIGQYAPGAAFPGPTGVRMAQGVIPGIAAESGGQAVRMAGGTRQEEDIARAGAGFAGSLMTGFRPTRGRAQPRVDTPDGGFQVRQTRPASPARTGSRHSRDVQTLRESGVQMTIGQRIGGPAKAAEDALASAPIIGPAIRGARERGVNSLNRAPHLRALGEIGEELPANLEPGAETVDFTRSQLGQAFDRALERVPAMRADQVLEDGFSAARAAHPDQAARFDAIVGGGLERVRGGVSGRQLREVQEQIQKEAARYRRGSPDDQRLGEMLEDASDDLLDLVGRTDPEAGKMLSQARAGYAQHVRGERAALSASAAPDTPGVFTPQQLGGAVRMTDGSVRRNQVARGQATMQDLSDASLRVMGKEPTARPGIETGSAVGLMTGAVVPNPAQPVAAITAGALTTGAVGYLATARKVVTSLPPNASTMQLRQAARELERLAAESPDAARDIRPLLEEVTRRIAQTAPAGAATMSGDREQQEP